jgi:hypothetical protein
MGPVETIDLNAPGAADYRRAADDQGVGAISPGAATGRRSCRPDAERRSAVPRDRLDAEQAWRDRRLMALAVHKKDAAKQFGK